jgi:Ca2+-binding RTX toxin-like protein
MNGLAGADRMTGGDGNDTYIVDNAGDVVVEVSGQGADLVRSGISSYTLGAYVENLELTGNAITGIGSAYGNKITGNDLANTLKGMGGDDIIRGGAGDDILDGGSGNDRINGGLGADKMYGGIDKDTFVFTSVSDSTANSIGRFNAATGDIIDRFVRGEDKIDLSAIDANAALAGDQSFHFGWDGKAGALTVTSLAKTVGGFPGYENHVFADIGGDGKADMVFVAYSFDKLTVTDFIL